MRGIVVVCACVTACVLDSVVVPRRSGSRTSSLLSRAYRLAALAPRVSTLQEAAVLSVLLQLLPLPRRLLLQVPCLFDNAAAVIVFVCCVVFPPSLSCYVLVTTRPGARRKSTAAPVPSAAPTSLDIDVIAEEFEDDEERDDLDDEMIAIDLDLDDEDEDSSEAMGTVRAFASEATEVCVHVCLGVGA
jgi:hypothetical protein